MMNTLQNYFYESEEIDEIFKKIINMGINKRRRYCVAAILIIVILILIIFILIYHMRNLPKGGIFDLISIILGILGIMAFVSFIIFIIKEDNRKYKFHNIPEEKIKEGLNRKTPSKIEYNNLINKKLDDALISSKILTNTYKDLIILDFHITRMNKEIEEKKIEPIFLRGSIGFLVLCITLAFEYLLVFYQNYGKIDSILLAKSIWFFLLSLSIYSFFYLASVFYRDVNNQRLFRLRQIISHLEAIKLRRLHENEKKSESKGKNKFSMILDILLS